MTNYENFRCTLWVYLKKNMISQSYGKIFRWLALNKLTNARSYNTVLNENYFARKTTDGALFFLFGDGEGAETSMNSKLNTLWQSPDLIPKKLLIIAKHHLFDNF